jgi:DNA modification methylase
VKETQSVHRLSFRHDFPFGATAPKLGAKMPLTIKTKKIHAAISDDFDEKEVPHQLNIRIQHTKLECVPIGEIKPNRRNAKKHPARQILLLVENYKIFGFTQPIIIDEAGMILCGHARYFAASKLGLIHLTAIRLSHLSPAEKRALSIADNKLAELGEWDPDILPEELGFLFDSKTELSFDPRLVGYETVEVDQILTDEPNPAKADPADQFEPLDPAAVAFTTTDDLWVCDSHKVLCASALESADYRRLLGEERADLGFADGPYNVPNAGHVTSRLDVREFAMAAGEMTSEAFIAFNRAFCTNLLNYLAAGAVVYLCMDWRHLPELRAAADPVFGALKNHIVWVKSNAGMGSFYRSQHEMILVYVTPGGRSTNNFGLGGKGRYRTNVWKYPGFNAFGRDRDTALAMHPTVKPVALVKDALLDCSNRGGIVLDPFGGSGTTMIAAECTGRRARLIEIDPLYCDLIVRRWQTFSGKVARLADTNETFDEVSARRTEEASIAKRGHHGSPRG